MKNLYKRGLELPHFLTGHFLASWNMWIAQRCTAVYKYLKNVLQNKTNWSKILIRYHPTVSSYINMFSIKKFYMLLRANFIILCESQNEQWLCSIEWIFLQCRRNVFTVRYKFNLQNEFLTNVGFKIFRYIFSVIQNTKRITYKKVLEIRCYVPSRKVNYYKESNLTLPNIPLFIVDNLPTPNLFINVKLTILATSYKQETSWYPTLREEGRLLVAGEVGAAITFRPNRERLKGGTNNLYKWGFMICVPNKIS